MSLVGVCNFEQLISPSLSFLGNELLYASAFTSVASETYKIAKRRALPHAQMHDVLLGIENDGVAITQTQRISNRRWNFHGPFVNFSL